jgi:8-oxo-dGTP diphosphatase
MGLEPIVVSGPVIIDNRKLLLIKDKKDDFYKFPGGRVEKGEDLESACAREAEEEINGYIRILRKLSTIYLHKDPKTGKPAEIELHHYRAFLRNKDEIKHGADIEDMRWFDLDELKSGDYKIAPNVRYLLERGELR